MAKKGLRSSAEAMLAKAIGELQRNAIGPALSAFEAACEADPAMAQAWHGQAVANFRLQRIDAAKKAIGCALALNPEDPAIRIDAARILRLAGDTREALDILDGMLRNAASPMILREAAETAFVGGDFERALGYVDSAIESSAGDLALVVNRGRILFELGDREGAEAAFASACARDPDRLDAVVNLVECRRKSAPEGALEPLRAFVVRHPDDSACQLQLAIQLAKGRETQDEAETILKGLFDRGIAGEVPAIHLSMVLARRSRFREARNILDAAQARLGARSGLDYARVNLDAAAGLLAAADASFRRMLGQGVATAELASNWLLFSHYIDGITPDDLADRHGRVSSLFASRPPLPATAPPPTMSDGRIAVAYVSPDCHEHSVSFFFESLLAAHDRKRFCVHVLSDSMTFDATNQRLRAHADHWVDCAGRSNHALYRYVQESEIAVLVDLAGHTQGNRMPLFAMRPAPLQVTWLGYPDTTGVQGIDLRLVDEITDPPGVADTRHSERLVRIGAPFVAYRPRDDAPDVTDPPCLSGEEIWFGCFNNFLKITQSTIALWARILAELPGARLLLKAGSADAFSDCDVRARILSEFERQGVDRRRVELVESPRSPVAHLEAYNRIDIALDTVPYNGTTTTCEALFMGVPVVTRAGDAHYARVGASLLRAVGLDALVACDDKGFLEAALSLASDRVALAEMRRGLRARLLASPLCDGRRLAKEIERAYIEHLPALNSGKSPQD